MRRVSYAMALALVLPAFGASALAPQTSSANMEPPPDSLVSSPVPDQKPLPAFDVAGDQKRLQATGDANLIKQLHLLNLTQIRKATLADSKSSSEKVRRFARSLLRDHAANDKLVVKLADRLGIELATVLPVERQLEVEQLRYASSESFDRMFLESSAAQYDVTALDVRIAQKTDVALQALCDNLMPMLQRHAAEARRLQERLAMAD